MVERKIPWRPPGDGVQALHRAVQFDTDYYYNSYPHAATNDVKAALRIQDAVDAVRQNQSGTHAGEFETAYVEFLVQVQPDLGPRA